MTNAALQFQDGDRLGRVAAVDTSRVLISVENHQHMTTIAVGNLIAIQGRTAAEFLIAVGIFPAPWGALHKANVSEPHGLVGI